MSFEFSRASHLSDGDVFSSRRCTASWSWHPELTVRQPCFVNTTVTHGTHSEQAVFISMCDSKLFVECHEVLKCYALEKNWGNCTTHPPMFAFVSVICSTLRSMEMASVSRLVFDLRIRSIEVGHNWPPFHPTMAFRFLSVQHTYTGSVFKIDSIASKLVVDEGWYTCMIFKPNNQTALILNHRCTELKCVGIFF